MRRWSEKLEEMLSEAKEGEKFWKEEIKKAKTEDAFMWGLVCFKVSREDIKSLTLMKEKFNGT